MSIVDPRDPTGLVTRATPITTFPSVETWRASRFQVICAGRPNLALANHELRVGIAAAVTDDAKGRALVEELRASGNDVTAVSYVARGARVVIADDGGMVAESMEDDPALVVPDAWSSELLLVNGVSPSLARAASLCRAARAARRTGAPVVLDVNARRQAWKGRDARTIQALLREADVVRCSTSDLAALWLDPASLRSAMRPLATLVLTQGPGAARASGPFGEVSVPAREPTTRRVPGAGDAFTAALCADLARTKDAGRIELWERALSAGHAAARGWMKRAR